MTSRVSTIVLVIGLLAAGFVIPPGSADDACRYEILGEVRLGDALAGVDVEVYDIRHAPGSEAVIGAYSPAEVRDAENKRTVARVTTASDGTFRACVGSDDVAEDGTMDLAIGVEADAPGATIYTPPPSDAGLSGGRPSTTTSQIYMAFSGESRNVGPGIVDTGAFQPTTPETYPMGGETVPGGSSGGDGVGSRTCTDDGEICICDPRRDDCDLSDSGLALANDVGSAFRVLAVLQDARLAVEDLDRRTHGADAKGPGHVRVIMPYSGCGAGCYYGGGLITLESASSGVALHEYGHHLEGRYAPSSPSGIHSCREHGQATDAWSGGFANLVGALVAGDASAAGCGNAETSGGQDGGQHHEANVQAALWDLVDDDTEDAYDGSDVRMWKVFTRKDEADYDDYEGFHDEWVHLFPNDEAALVSVACQNGMTFAGCS